MKKQQPKPPTVYVIAGPNGAGKTTFAFTAEIDRCRRARPTHGETEAAVLPDRQQAENDYEEVN